ncbi:MAG: hypothetical protein GQ542_13795 [Desulforhopalus sp.]|nr:hypothetical protein [Desulforhopalus sp.]
MSRRKEKKLLNEAKDVLRLEHYSIHTERSFCDWIKRYVLLHKMTSRMDLSNGEQKIEQFPSHLAVSKNIAPATQNQAMNALVFLYKRVLKIPLNDEIKRRQGCEKSQHTGCYDTRRSSSDRYCYGRYSPAYCKNIVWKRA